MKNFNKTLAAPNTKVLSPDELNKVKGGFFELTCEEKRGNFFGIQYTRTVWSIKPNGSLFPSIRM